MTGFASKVAITAFSPLLFVGMAARCTADQAPSIERHPEGTDSFEGACPSLSPNGRLVAIRRYVPDDSQLGSFRDPNPMREDLWIRDLKTGAQRLLRKDCRALEWLSDNTLALSSTEVIDALTGVVRGRGSGRRAAVVDADSLRFPAGEAKTIRLPLGHRIVADIVSQEKGFVWVSPRGEQVAFDLLMSRPGDVPLRRIGVAQVDTAKVAYVGELAYCHYNWGYQAQERRKCKTDPWTPDGTRFAFVSGRGDGEAILQLANANGSEVLRLADDESCKWSPVFDPVGRRLAYYAAQWGGEDGTLLDGHIRVLDIYTREEHRIAPAGDPGLGLAIAWSPDGSEVIHDWHPGKSLFERQGIARTYRVKMPKSKPVAPGSVIKAIPAASKEDDLVAAIRSASSAVVSWGVEHVDEAPTGRVKTALCEALAEWFPREVPCAGEIVDALTRLETRDAIPAFRKALLLQPEPINIPDGTAQDRRRAYRPQYQPNAVCGVITALVNWKVKASAAELRTYTKRFPDSEPAVYAVGALAAFGEEDRWQQIASYKVSRDKEIRSRVTGILSLIRDPRAVDLLIDLVSDREALYYSVDGETQVGDHAVDSLQKLTGQKIGRDVNAWRAWWTEQSRKLPPEQGE